MVQEIVLDPVPVDLVPLAVRIECPSLTAQSDGGHAGVRGREPAWESL